MTLIHSEEHTLVTGRNQMVLSYGLYVRMMLQVCLSVVEILWQNVSERIANLNLIANVMK